MKLYPHGETPSTPRRSANLHCGISSLFEYTGPSKTMEAKAAGEAVIDRFIAEKMAALEAERVRLDMLRVQWRSEKQRDWLPLKSRHRLRRGK